MTPKLLSIVFIMLSLSTRAQDKTFMDYYFEAKTLADSFKTYQILVQAHGETHPFISNAYIKNEVARSFNFLKIKTPVTENPDFVINIIVSDVRADVTYIYKGRTGDDDNYDIIWIYDVSFALSFESTNNTVYVPICTKKHLEKTFPYSPRVAVSGASLERFQTQYAERQKPVDQYVKELNETLNTKAVFLPDFNEELVKFRKKK